MQMQMHEILTKAMDYHGIKVRELAALVGMAPNHLTELRAGRKWVSRDNFIKLLDGMDKLRPGARLYFCQLLAGEALAPLPAPSLNLIDIIENASDEEIEEVLIAIGRKWKKSRSSTVKNGAEVTNFYVNVSSQAPDKIAV